MLPLIYTPKVSAEERRERAIKLLTDVGLGHRLENTPAKLSGGEKQRVAIARALIGNPAVIFADEPTGNLDSKSGAQVMKILQELNAQGHTIILVTHERSTAEHAERIIEIRDGNINRDSRVDDRRIIKEGQELTK
jgi:ABC-type lipoprotein export system ATPase subunit